MGFPTAPGGRPGGQYSQVARASGAEDFPYDRQTKYGKNGTGDATQSGGLEIIPMDTKHTHWDEAEALVKDPRGEDDHGVWDRVAEAIGVPYNTAMSSKGGNHNGYIPGWERPRIAGDDEATDYDKLDLYGEAWQALVDFLARPGDDIELSNCAKEDEVVASKTWRGLNPPEDK